MFVCVCVCVCVCVEPIHELCIYKENDTGIQNNKTTRKKFRARVLQYTAIYSYTKILFLSFFFFFFFVVVVVVAACEIYNSW